MTEAAAHALWYREDKMNYQLNRSLFIKFFIIFLHCVAMIVFVTTSTISKKKKKKKREFPLDISCYPLLQNL